MTAKICDIYETELGIPQDAVYVKMCIRDRKTTETGKSSSGIGTRSVTHNWKFAGSVCDIGTE